MRKLSSIQLVDVVDALTTKSASAADLARAYGVSPSRISQIKKKFVGVTARSKAEKTDDMGMPLDDGVALKSIAHPTVMPRGGFGMAVVKKEGEPITDLECPF